MKTYMNAMLAILIMSLVTNVHANLQQCLDPEELTVIKSTDEVAYTVKIPDNNSGFTYYSPQPLMTKGQDAVEFYGATYSPWEGGTFFCQYHMMDGTEMDGRFELSKKIVVNGAVTGGMWKQQATDLPLFFCQNIKKIKNGFIQIPVLDVTQCVLNY